MKKQLLFTVLGLAALLSTAKTFAYHMYGTNYAPERIVATMERASGGWYDQTIGPNEGFDLGDGDRCFECVKFRAETGDNAGRSAEICRYRALSCTNWNDVKIDQIVRNGKTLLQVDGKPFTN